MFVVLGRESSVMSGSSIIRELVKAGQLCYNCEKIGAEQQGEPLYKDEFSGMICRECFELLKAMRLKYALADGKVKK